jgi:hypothetical protein
VRSLSTAASYLLFFFLDFFFAFFFAAFFFFLAAIDYSCSWNPCFSTGKAPLPRRRSITGVSVRSGKRWRHMLEHRLRRLWLRVPPLPLLLMRDVFASRVTVPLIRTERCSVAKASWFAFICFNISINTCGSDLSRSPVFLIRVVCRAPVLSSSDASTESGASALKRFMNTRAMFALMIEERFSRRHAHDRCA